MAKNLSGEAKKSFKSPPSGISEDDRFYRATTLEADGVAA